MLRRLPPIQRLLLLMLLVLSSHWPASAQPRRPVGIDSTAHRFDVVHIAIDVGFDLQKKEVIGSVVHRIRASSPGLAQVRLHAAANMRFARVAVDGIPANYRQFGDTLEVDLPSPARRTSDTFLLRLDYRVVPTKGLYFVGLDSAGSETRRQIWTQGQEQDNRYWVPLYDYPDDRSTSEVTLRVISEWKGLSNGSLRSVTRNDDGTSSWHWVMEKPHSSYLIMLAAGDYLVTRDTVARIPLEYWSYPDLPDHVMPTFGRTPAMFRYFERLLGIAYPWSQYSQIMLDKFMYGGMENTTATTLNDYLLVDARGLIDDDPDPTIAHEIAHQWFGDLVTNRRWADLWIHESYATHLENLWMREKVGSEWYAREVLRNGLEGIESDLRNGRDPLVNGRGLTENLYPRGARILHILSELVGEQTFWNASRLFLERHSYDLVETADLQRAFEEVSGRDLGWFFDQWIYRAGYPELRVDQSYSGGMLQMVVSQVQKVDSLAGLFRLSVPLEFHLGTTIVRDTVALSRAVDTFRFSLPQAPRFVIFDAGDATLKTVAFPKTDEQLIAQLEAPRFIDRLHAVLELTRSKPGGKMDLSRLAALHRHFPREKSPFVREEIVAGVVGFDSPLVGEVIGMALADSASKVRRQGVDRVFLIADRDLRNRLLVPLLDDSSRHTSAAALGMLAAAGMPGLEPHLVGLRGVRGRFNATAISWLNAVAAGGYRLFVDDVAAYAMPHESRMLRSYAYNTLAYLDTTSAGMLDAVEAGLRDSSASIRLYATTVARRRRGPEIDRLLLRLRDELGGEARQNVARLLKEEILPPRKP